MSLFLSFHSTLGASCQSGKTYLEEIELSSADSSIGQSLNPVNIVATHIASILAKPSKILLSEKCQEHQKYQESKAFGGSTISPLGLA
jgi:hypothetical protein